MNKGKWFWKILVVELRNYMLRQSNSFMNVRELSREVEKDQKENCSELSEDKFLDMIWIEMGEFVFRKSTPIWQHLLSFLYKEGCGSLVSLLEW